MEPARRNDEDRVSEDEDPKRVKSEPGELTMTPVLGMLAVVGGLALFPIAALLLCIGILALVYAIF